MPPARAARSNSLRCAGEVLGELGGGGARSLRRGLRASAVCGVADCGGRARPARYHGAGDRAAVATTRAAQAGRAGCRSAGLDASGRPRPASACRVPQVHGGVGAPGPPRPRGACLGGRRPPSARARRTQPGRRRGRRRASERAHARRTPRSTARCRAARAARRALGPVGAGRRGRRRRRRRAGASARASRGRARAASAASPGRRRRARRLGKRCVSAAVRRAERLAGRAPAAGRVRAPATEPAGRAPPAPRSRAVDGARHAHARARATSGPSSGSRAERRVDRDRVGVEVEQPPAALRPRRRGRAGRSSWRRHATWPARASSVDDAGAVRQPQRPPVGAVASPPRRRARRARPRKLEQPSAVERRPVRQAQRDRARRSGSPRRARAPAQLASASARRPRGPCR